MRCWSLSAHMLLGCRRGAGARQLVRDRRPHASQGGGGGPPAGAIAAAIVGAAEDGLCRWTSLRSSCVTPPSTKAPSTARTGPCPPSHTARCAVPSSLLIAASHRGLTSQSHTSWPRQELSRPRSAMLQGGASPASAAGVRRPVSALPRPVSALPRSSPSSSLKRADTGAYSKARPRSAFPGTPEGSPLQGSVPATEARGARSRPTTAPAGGLQRRPATAASQRSGAGGSGRGAIRPTSSGARKRPITPDVSQTRCLWQHGAEEGVQSSELTRKVTHRM